ncbi:polyadenylation/uridylation factor 1 [Trypanosoma theileri]|uniref:Polyadenylation/uridylation factor 1 n=1 Tax=Trypanosoma theileri TaxID=67003 RepID=A0A1X0NLE6_9TRYP|nr:polyadenylation/uridylation factor 1 [Trypanosoma theileri]ORC84930.1 polyadenylation/uridylation factor 1 [Trypanosoma theileri]
MFRRQVLLSRRAAFSFTTGWLNRTASFQPFSQKDEDDLVRVVKTKPRHVLKHVRQQVWRSRKRELHFRNTVTHLMIVLQEFLRKQLIDPTNASQIMEGIMEECVKYSQHDMAHLLFRAFLRFRKYGCTISIDALRFLFESYKENDSSELMLQLANEMRGDPALRPLCIAAYLFANHPDEAETLREGLSFSELTRDDIVALIDGYDKLQKTEKVMEVLQSVNESTFTAEDLTDIFRAFFRVFYRRDDEVSFAAVFQAALDKSVVLDAATFAIILRQRMRHVTGAEEIAAVENELKEFGYVPDVTGNSIIIAAYARLMHFGDRGSEELMLSKVDTLLSSIESRLKQGDPDMDISAAHIRAVIRGYGAAGRPESIKTAWTRMQHKGLTNDVRVYNELFKWFALMGNVKDVIALKEEMDTEGVHPDSQTYAWMLRALGKYYPRHVERLYEEMQQKHVRPDIQLYNTLLGIFGDLGDTARVEAIVKEMMSREEFGTLQLTPVTFAVLIRIYSNNLEKAEEAYAEAKKRGMTDHPHVQTSMLHVYAHHGDGSDRLENFLKEIPTWSTDVYNVLLNKYGKDGQREKVNELIEKMKTEEVAMNDVTFGTLITAFARWGDGDKVRDVIQLLKEHEGEVSAAFYSVLASSLSKMGDVDGVSNAWDDLISSKLFPDTEVYNQFLLLYSKQHNASKMQTVLNNMMKQIPPNPVTATTILDMLGKSGRVAEMESLFEDMKLSPDTLPTSVTYHQMMNTYAKTGDVAKMEKLHAEFIEKGYTNNAVTYNILADGYGRAKRFDRMEEILQQRRKMDVPLDDLVYCIMITAYGRARLKKEVQRVYAEVTSPESSHLFTRKVIWSCIDAFCRCGAAEEMEKCVEDLKRTNETGPTSTNRTDPSSSSSSDNSNSNSSHSASDVLALIPYYCRLGDMNRVDELREKAKAMNTDLSYTALNAIARGYAKAGRFEKTVETLHLMRDRNWVPDASTALSLSSAFLKAGLHEQAQQVVQWRRQYAKHAGEEVSSSPEV